MALPTRTDIDDLRAIVNYLRNKPTGATVDEVKAALGGSAVDQRKLSAYAYWDMIVEDEGRLKLTTRGWSLARKPETERQVIREILDRSAVYRSALEWIHYQGFDDVTYSDVAAQWHEHHREALGTTNENTIKENVGVFFNLAEAAGLGRLFRGGGRAKKPSRFHVDREELRQYVEAGPKRAALERSWWRASDRGRGVRRRDADRGGQRRAAWAGSSGLDGAA